MRFVLVHCVCFMLFFRCGDLYAQVIGGVDTIPKSDTLRAYQVRFGDFDSPKKSQRLINDLDGLHRYHPHLDVVPVRNDLGNLGSSNHVVLFNFDRPFGFAFTDSRSMFFRRTEDRQFLLTDKAFTNVRYVNGQNRENYLQADFARAFGTMLNAGFHFGRVNSEGFYGNQQNRVTDFSLNAAFNSRDLRYRAQFVFGWQDLENRENGGLLDNAVFENNQTSGRAFIPTRLGAAENERVGVDVGLVHRLALPRMWLADSSYYNKRFVPVVEHSMVVARHAHTYSDVPVAGGFYENIFRDSVGTRDSTMVLGVTNIVRLKLLANDSSETQTTGVLENAYAGIGHSYHQVNFDSTSLNAIHNVFLDAGVDGNLFGKYQWWAKNRFMLIGRNVLDNRIEGGLGLILGGTRMSADALYHVFRPDYITERYVSNHFMFDNEFGKTNHLSMGFRFAQWKWRTSVDARYHLLQNLVVFGTDRLPYQSTGVNQLLVIRAKQQFAIRWFHFDMDAAVQFILSGDDIRLPMALGRGMVYYQGDIFKKRLRLQLGYEVSYSSAYLANAYNPALSMFYLQNDRQIGNYPFMDVFLNIRIKTFQAFFKMEHWNAGLMGYRYYHVPHHPANDMAWKFGIRWAFLD
jgi:hypothetical protein